MQLGNCERLGEHFPYLNVAKSFANTLNHPKTLCLQCSKCEQGFQRPNDGAPKCPFKCKKRLLRRRNVSDKVLTLLHVFRFHLSLKEAVTYVRNWPEKYNAVMEDEPIYKFDVLESLERSLDDSPCIKCTLSPVNDRVPQLPSSDEELNSKPGSDQPTRKDDSGKKLKNVDTLKMTTETHHAEDDEDSGTSSRHATELGEEPPSSATIFVDAPAHDMRLPSRTVIDTSVPTTSTPKQQKTCTSSSAKGSILSWLSPISRSVVPQQPAELTLNQSRSLGSLRDALIDNSTTMNASAVKATSAHVSEEGTLFDELPQRIVKKMVLQTNPPEDISHIKGATGYPCNFCTFKARTVGDIRRHTSMVHSEVLPSLSTKIISPCNFCNEVFQKRSLLLKHITDHHMNVRDPFK
ncbi:zinc finger, C2H2 type [Oesophagostomum dentatum]|uniref:Zinc finger, C2H2 type n=1 Tax=Oesophagostomum dentatum TaxID=61180 RepID=A0A0B1TDH4_OESDE|nr:zinc finger, C2H2 type [Oesophagostomum dentatum]